MEKEFVSYEVAVALKELGAGFPYIAWYLPNNPILILHPAAITTTDIPAPLKQQVFRWFRQKYGVYPTIMTETEDDSLYFRFIAEGGPEWLSFSKIYYTYEEAEDACIDKLIELAKQQDK